MFLMIRIDEERLIEKDYGYIEKKDIKNIIELAEKKDFACLQFLDLSGDTIFNGKQLKEVKKEIEELKKEKINQVVFSKINRAVNDTLKEDYSYLKFVYLPE